MAGRLPQQAVWQPPELSSSAFDLHANRSGRMVPRPAPPGFGGRGGLQLQSIPPNLQSMDAAVGSFELANRQQQQAAVVAPPPPKSNVLLRKADLAVAAGVCIALLLTLIVQRPSFVRQPSTQRLNVRRTLSLAGAGAAVTLLIPIVARALS